MIELVLLWLISAASAEPDTVPAPPEPGTPTTAPAPEGDGSFGSVLEEAKELYFRGESSEARDLLQGLQMRLYAGEEVEWSLVVEALTYLGEIYYVRGDQTQAETAFEYLLSKDPTTPISPYHHAMDVVTLFELVRGRVVRKAEETPPTPTVVRTPAPLWIFAPFGIPQIAQGRTAVGLFYGTLQAGLGATSIALYTNLLVANPPLGSPGNALGWEPETIRPRVFQRLYVQWPATIAFYALWGISAIDAGRWHQRHPRITGVGIEPLPSDPTNRRGAGGSPILVIHGQL